MRLVAPDGAHRVVPYAEALAAAREGNQDLLCVQAQAEPPVYRLGSRSRLTYAVKARPRRLLAHDCPGASQHRPARLPPDLVRSAVVHLREWWSP